MIAGEQLDMPPLSGCMAGARTRLQHAQHQTSLQQMRGSSGEAN
jgi:hypothetical protein